MTRKTTQILNNDHRITDELTRKPCRFDKVGMITCDDLPDNTQAAITELPQYTREELFGTKYAGIADDFVAAEVPQWFLPICDECHKKWYVCPICGEEFEYRAKKENDACDDCKAESWGE